MRNLDYFSCKPHDLSGYHKGGDQAAFNYYLASALV